MLRRPRFLAILSIISDTASAAAGTPCLALRPTDVTADWSYAGAEAGNFDTPEGNVRVWYATSGKHATPSVAGLALPPAVTAAGAAAETALARYVELGFRRPAGDADSPCPDNGGNERLDLYLFDFNAPPLRTPAPHHRPAGCSIVPGAPRVPQSLVAFLATSGVVLWSLRRTPRRRLVSRRSS